MGIERDLSELPRQHDSGGLVPDSEPRFVQALVESWAMQDDNEGPRPLASTTARFRHSDAGKCARLISYKAVGIAPSDPMDLSGTNNVHVGTLLHNEWQEALMSAHAAEVEVKLHTLDGLGAGHADAVIEVDGKRIVYEFKTIGGYGFKSAIGKAARNRPAEGPKSDHLLQGALNAHAVDADELVIGYLAKEAISVNQSKGMPELLRFAAEWTFPRDVFVPLAERELERIAAILALVDEGTLAARKIPDLPASAEITDPSSGLWEQRAGEEIVDTGSWWGCAYCSHQSLCAQTERGRIAVESVVALTKRVA